MYLQTPIRQGFSKRQHPLAIFLDIIKAFDTTGQYKIIRTVRAWRFRAPLRQCLASFPRDRSFYIRTGDIYSQPSILDNGVPQGAVFSPLLFSIAISDIVSAAPPPIKAAILDLIMRIATL